MPTGTIDTLQSGFAATAPRAIKATPAVMEEKSDLDLVKGDFKRDFQSNTFQW